MDALHNVIQPDEWSNGVIVADLHDRQREIDLQQRRFLLLGLQEQHQVTGRGARAELEPFQLRIGHIESLEQRAEQRMDDQAIVDGIDVVTSRTEKPEPARRIDAEQGVVAILPAGLIRDRLKHRWLFDFSDAFELIQRYQPFHPGLYGGVDVLPLAAPALVLSEEGTRGRHPDG